jgi:hypothetical protein
VKQGNASLPPPSMLKKLIINMADSQLSTITLSTFAIYIVVLWIKMPSVLLAVMNVSEDPAVPIFRVKVQFNYSTL